MYSECSHHINMALIDSECGSFEKRVTYKCLQFHDAVITNRSEGIK